MKIDVDENKKLLKLPLSLNNIQMENIDLRKSMSNWDEWILKYK